MAKALVRQRQNQLRQEGDEAKNRAQGNLFWAGHDQAWVWFLVRMRTHQGSIKSMQLSCNQFFPTSLRRTFPAISTWWPAIWRGRGWWPGAADAALGLRAVAVATGLDFVPLEVVRCDLVIPQDLQDHPALKVLLTDPLSLLKIISAPI